MEQFQKFYEKKRVLVTGGAGFIGSHLVEKLVSLRAQVTVLDNFSTGCLNNLKNVANAITILYSDVRSAYACTKATVGHDIVFHLASFISVPDSIKQPELCHNINVAGTVNMLEACSKNKAKTLIFSSSSAVYGQTNKVVSEDDPLNPMSPYATSKLEAETACKQYAALFGVDTAILRYFNVYGERQNPQGPYAAVVAKFTQQLLNGQPLTIFGDGTQTRDFINVSDVVQANLALGMRENQKGEVFNIGSGKSITLLELIDQLEQELKVKRTTLDFQPPRYGDILNSKANCAKYKNFMRSH